jgi:predicted MFS family arabinose efflux permease
MTTPAVGTSYRDVLRLPYVARLLGATLLGRLAEEMFALIIVLYVLTVYASPRLAGVAVLASVVPGLVVSPIAGALLDRVGPVRGITVDLAASAILVIALAFAARPGLAGSAVLVTLAGLFSLTSPLSLAGGRTLIPRLVPSAALERVNALDSGSYNLVDVLAPATAGVVFAAFGGRTTLLVVAGLYVAAWLALQTLHADAGRAAPMSRRPSLVREAIDGVRHVLSHAVLRALAVSYGLYEVAFGILVVTVPYVVAGTAHSARQHSAKVGVLWATVGLAGIVSALLAGRLSRIGREREAIAIGILVTCLATPLMAFGHVAGLVLGLVAIGLAAGPVNVGLLTLRQRRTDPALLGRVLAVSISLNVLGAPIGSAIAGSLIGSTHSAVLAFLAAGAAAGLGLVAACLLLQSDRGADDRAASQDDSAAGKDDSAPGRDEQRTVPTFPA